MNMIIQLVCALFLIRWFQEDTIKAAAKRAPAPKAAPESIEKPYREPASFHQFEALSDGGHYTHDGKPCPGDDWRD